MASDDRPTGLLDLERGIATGGHAEGTPTSRSGTPSAPAEEISGWDSREFAGIAWMTTGGILATPAETLGPHLKRAVRKLAALTDAPG
jgi:hypothetical protein